MKSEIIKVETKLPVRLEDLTRFVLIGREKLVSVRAEMRAIDKLGLATEVKEQKKEEATMLAGALLDAEVKIGELLKTDVQAHTHQKKIPKGITRKQSSQFQALADHKDIIEIVKKEAIENDDLPTRTEVLRRIKEQLNESSRVGKEWIRYFDVWNFASIDDDYGIDYPGRIPYEIIANTLYYFTNEGDLIVDPMAGGGTTIDVCKKMDRKCLAYDLAPVRKDIKEWDLSGGLSEEAMGCGLIFLDPPYWKKKANDYNSEAISNKTKEEYLAFFEKLAKDCKASLKENGHLAFLMSNYIEYGKPEDSIFVADYYQLFKNAGFIPVIEIQCPLSSQQYAGFQVNQAKELKKLLIISRSLFVFKNGKIS